MPAATSSASIKSAQRVLDILEVLADRRHQQASLAELARQLGIPKSSLHGLLRLLVNRGYVDPSPDSRSYRLGPRVLGLANSYLDGFDLHQAARPVMVAIARLTEEAVTLDIPHGSSMITIAREAGQQPIRVVTRIGMPFAAHATASGKVILASLPDERLEELFPAPDLPPFTRRTIRTVEQLRQELLASRRSGVAYAHGEINEGVEAIAVPVIGHDPQVVAALDVLVPQHRAQPEHMRRIELILRAGARIVSARLGAPAAPTDFVVEVDSHLEQIWATDGKRAL